MTGRLGLAAIAGVLAACGRPAPSTAAATNAPPVAAPAAPADTLLFRTATGAEVWFTFARHDSAPGGRACVERTIEIRQAGTRVPVPLLYTGAPPVLRDDTTLEADLWAACAPRARYRVDLRTGQPIPEAGR